MSTQPLAALLQIIEDPAHPAFAEALQRLETLDFSHMDKAELAPLIARLDAAIASLTRQRESTTHNLEDLRLRARALRSYGGKK